MLPAIPVTVLTGFLGAGKTTLLQYMLAAEHGLRLAVIENEYSRAPIDGHLLGDRPITLVTLANGCICCSMGGELENALLLLLEKRRIGELEFDRVVIECTGLADPAPVAHSVLTTPVIDEGYRLDGIVTVVDAVNASRHLLEPIAQAQVGFADLLVLSKTDLLEAQAVDKLRARLQRINRRAGITVAKQGRMPLEQLLDLRGFELQAVASSTLTLRPTGTTVAADRIQTLVLEGGEITDLDALSAFVEALLRRYGPALLRYKGMLAVQGEPCRLLFQGVLSLNCFDWDRPWAADEARESVMVLIGDQLPHDAINQMFAELLVS